MKIIPLTALLSGNSLEELSLLSPRATTVLFWSLLKPIALLTRVTLIFLSFFATFVVVVALFVLFSAYVGSHSSISGVGRRKRYPIDISGNCFGNQCFCPYSQSDADGFDCGLVVLSDRQT